MIPHGLGRLKKASLVIMVSVLTIVQTLITGTSGEEKAQMLSVQRMEAQLQKQEAEGCYLDPHAPSRDQSGNGVRF